MLAFFHSRRPVLVRSSMSDEMMVYGRLRGVTVTIPSVMQLGIPVPAFICGIVDVSLPCLITGISHGQRI